MVYPYVIFASNQQDFPLIDLLSRTAIINQTSIKKIKEEPIDEVLLNSEEKIITLNKEKQEELFEILTQINITNITEYYPEENICEIFFLKNGNSTLKIKVADDSLVVNDAEIACIINDTMFTDFVKDLLK